MVYRFLYLYKIDQIQMYKIIILKIDIYHFSID